MSSAEQNLSLSFVQLVLQGPQLPHSLQPRLLSAGGDKNIIMNYLISLDDNLPIFYTGINYLLQH